MKRVLCFLHLYHCSDIKMWILIIITWSFSKPTKLSILNILNITPLEIEILPWLVLLWLQICLQWGTSRLIGRTEEIEKRKKSFGFRTQKDFQNALCMKHLSIQIFSWKKRRKVWIVILFIVLFYNWLTFQTSRLKSTFTKERKKKSRFLPPSVSVLYVPNLWIFSQEITSLLTCLWLGI